MYEFFIAVKVESHQKWQTSAIRRDISDSNLEINREIRTVQNLESPGLFGTPVCNRPSGTYILTGFEKKKSQGRQIFHQVASFCQVVRCFPYSNIHK